MPSTDTVVIPTVDSPEGGLWREIVAHDDTTAAVIDAGDSGMLVGGSALSPPDLVAKVDQADADDDRGVSLSCCQVFLGGLG